MSARSNDDSVHGTQPFDLPQTDPQRSPNAPAIPGENDIFATSVGPQEPLTVAKIDLVERPATPRERLATTLARLSSQGIREVLAMAVDGEQMVVVHKRGRPEALDAPSRKKVLLLLTLGYTRALAAAELGISRSTIHRTMQRDADFRQQVLDAEELFERTPLLTIIEAAQRHWRAAAWLMKNYQPHASVKRRKGDEQWRESTRDTKKFFQTDFFSKPKRKSREEDGTPRRTSKKKGSKSAVSPAGGSQ
jgi:hypothetical protein